MIHSRAPHELERVETEDGSETYRLAGTDITYRSIHGARTEAEHVFVHSTGLPTRSGCWRVVELGFGLGTNFRATAAAAERAGVALEFCSVERAPVPEQCVGGADPFSALARSAIEQVRSGSFEAVERREGLTLRLIAAGWLDDGWSQRWRESSPGGAHAVFFDPFGPRIEPESWTGAAFGRARSLMAPDAILSTYSVAVRVKRTMAQAGLHVAVAPGPPFKNEISLASPSEVALDGYPIVQRPA